MYKKFKACPDGGIRCGNSSACFPRGTVCKEDRVKKDAGKKPRAIINNGKSEKTSEKIKNSTKVIPWKVLVAAGTVTTVVGGSLLYLKVKDNNIKALYPTKFENTAAPGNLTPLSKSFDNISTLDVPSDNSAAESNQKMFEKKSINLGDRAGVDSVKYVKKTNKITGKEEEGLIILDGEEKGIGKKERANNPDKIPYNKEQFQANQHEQKLYNHKLAREWAFNVLTDKDTVILDLETTSLINGLDPYSPEAYRKVRANVPGIFQIGLVEASTHNSLDIKLNPERKLSNIAQEITGSDGKDLDQYAKFKDYYPKLNKLLENKTVLAFNARFDMTVIDSLCEENNLPLINYKNRPAPGQPMDNNADVMHWYALYMGKGARSDFSNGKYEPLTGLAYASLPKLPGQKAHDARSDCWSTVDVLRVMANGEKPRDMKVEEAKAWDFLMDKKQPVKNSATSSNLNQRNSVNTKAPTSLMAPSSKVQVSEADTIISNGLALADKSKKFKAEVPESYDAYSSWGKALSVNTDVEPDINYSKTKRGSAEYRIKPLISDKELEEEKIRQKNLRQYIDKYTKKADSIINEALS